jgi:putative flippase GtrA
MIIRRWIKFNAVGMMGGLVQLAALWVLVHAAGLEYLIATAIAVEIALLHNFVWHQRWTWKGLPRRGWFARFVRFQAASGTLSIVSNTALTFVFKEYAGAPVLVANAGAMAVMALVNFWLASSWVFRDTAS